MSEHGKILDVTSERIGDQLAVAATATDTVLQLDDASPFSQTGGMALISDDTNSELIEYTSVDLDTDEMTLAAGLVNSYIVEAPVIVSPEALVTWASVRLDWDDDRPIRARIPYSMKAQLGEGIRDETLGESESVLVELDASQWFVVDILGANPGINASFIDPATLVAVGCRVYKSVNQSCTTAGDGMSAVTWNQEVFDSHDIHDTVTNNTRFTIPEGLDGHWRIRAHMSLEQNTNQHSRSITSIRTNGDDASETRMPFIGHDNVGGYAYDVEDTLDLEVGDYVEIYFRALDENHSLQSGRAETSCTMEFRGH